MPRPSIRPERDFSAQCGGCLVAGIDEAGRGPIAGPVVAAAVVWNPEGKRPPSGLGDSKLLTHDQRERLFDPIRRAALAWGIGHCTPAEIDVLNILGATRMAAVRAFEQLTERLPGERRVGALVTDYLELPALGLPTLPLVKGDQKSASIAAASILAKVARDRLMAAYHQEFPEYGWNENKGYPTDSHREITERLGPTSLHRLTFAGVSFFCSTPRRSPTHDRLARLLAATPPTRDAYLALGDQIVSVSHRLPPADFEDLLAALSSRAPAAGLAPVELQRDLVERSRGCFLRAMGAA